MLLTFLFFAKLWCAVCLFVCLCDGTCDGDGTCDDSECVFSPWQINLPTTVYNIIVAMIFVYKLANKIVLLLHDVVWC